MPFRFFALAFAFFVQSPDVTLPAPADVQSAVSVEGRGVQIYRCDPQSAGFQWILKAPEAKLFDVTTSDELGSHGTGPQWTWKDGSSVRGEVIQKTAQPDSIPWLLLRSTPVAGTPTGTLTRVTWIRRSATKGGNASTTGCDAAHAGSESRIPYTATYTFYTTR